MISTRMAVGLILAAPLLAGCGSSERKLFRTTQVTLASPLSGPLQPIPPVLPARDAPPALAVTPTSVRIEAPREPASPAEMPASLPRADGPAEAAADVPRRTPGILIQPEAQVQVTRTDEAPPAPATPQAPRVAPVAALPEPRPEARPAPTRPRAAAPPRTDATGTRIRRADGNGWEVL